MNDKWSSLVNAPVPDVGSVAPVLDSIEKPAGQSSRSVVIVFFVLALAAVVAGGIALKVKSHKKVNKVASKRAKVAKTVELIQTALAEEAPVPADATVEPKTAGSGDSEIAVEGASAYLEANGLTFSDFEKAFGLGREKPLMDKPERNYSTVLEDLAALRPALEASGQTFQDYIEAHHMKVPDALLDLWANGSTSGGPPGANEDLAPEAMMLAREALQPLSADVPEAAAAEVLREILAARTEAARLGLSLPEMPSEQASAVRAWAAKAPGVAGQLAQTLMSRY